MVHTASGGSLNCIAGGIAPVTNEARVEQAWYSRQVENVLSPLVSAGIISAKLSTYLESVDPDPLTHDLLADVPQGHEYTISPERAAYLSYITEIATYGMQGVLNANEVVKCLSVPYGQQREKLQEVNQLIDLKLIFFQMASTSASSSVEGSPGSLVSGNGLAADLKHFGGLIKGLPDLLMKVAKVLGPESVLST